jgi:hypothetical protein
MPKKQNEELPDNVVSLNKWRNDKKIDTDGKSFTTYLDVLNFNELIQESTDLVKELHDEKLNNELVMRSQLVLEEVDKRIKSESKELSGSLDSIRQKIDKALSNITKLLQ